MYADLHGYVIVLSDYVLQGWIYWGGGVHPSSPGQGGAIFHDKAKDIS
jgi:hypothetical protein